MKILFFVSLLLISPLSFAEQVRPTVTVRGTCLKSITPDRGSVTLTAKVKEKDAGAAVQKATDFYNKLLEKSKALKLKDAEYSTTNYSVNEEHDWSSNKRVSLGFTARMGLEVSTSEIKRLGDIIKIGSELKLEEAGNLVMFVSETKMKNEYESCLEEATKNAKIKAESIAKGASVRLGKLIEISESGTTPPHPPLPMMMAKSARAEYAADMASAPEVSTKDTKITVNVEATFGLD